MVNTADAVPLFSLDAGDLDAFHVLPNGNYLLSSLFNGDAGGNTFDDGDLIEYDPVANTIVGNYLGIGNSAFATTGEDITAATTDELGNLYFSTLSDATLNHAGGALSFTDGDVIKVDAATGIATIFIAEADLWDDGDSDVYGLHWMGDGTMLITSNADEFVDGEFILDGDIFRYDIASGIAIETFFSEANFTSANTHDIDAIYFAEQSACFGDCDGNGTLNIDDIDCFVAAFLGSDLAGADCDANGTLNIDDIDCFVTSFLSGCL